MARLNCTSHGTATTCLWDHHLSRFTGSRNLSTMLALIADYTWESEALRKFLAYIPRFLAARDRGDRSCPTRVTLVNRNG